jgi:hypothetical protein
MKSSNTFFFCSALIFLAGCSSVGPLYRSDDKLRASILEHTPLGSSRDQVYAFIHKQHWTFDDDETAMLDENFLKNHSDVGASMVDCNIGTTIFVTFPFETDVRAYWDFDKQDRLIDVWVNKDNDSQ